MKKKKSEAFVYTVEGKIEDMTMLMFGFGKDVEKYVRKKKC